MQYGVGSILNVADQALTVDKWHDMIRQIQEAATKKTRLGIPVIYGIDSIHGANYVQGATLFPQEIGMAATWNPELMKRGRPRSPRWKHEPPVFPGAFRRCSILDANRSGHVSGKRSAKIHISPVLWAWLLCAAWKAPTSLRQDRVASSLKHYMGYSFPLTGRDRTPAWIPENYLREYFLPPFAAAVKAGARTIMVNSGEINGVPGHINHHILTDILRDELGFKGFVVSDWEDIKKLVTIWRVAATEKEATQNGCDGRHRHEHGAQ